MKGCAVRPRRIVQRVVVHLIGQLWRGRRLSAPLTRRVVCFCCVCILIGVPINSSFIVFVRVYVPATFICSSHNLLTVRIIALVRGMALVCVVAGLVDHHAVLLVLPPLCEFYRVPHSLLGSSEGCGLITDAAATACLIASSSRE